jgi:hypothetical protein
VGGSAGHACKSSRSQEDTPRFKCYPGEVQHTMVVVPDMSLASADRKLRVKRMRVPVDVPGSETSPFDVTREPSATRLTLAG